MRSKRTLSRLKRHSAILMLTGMTAFQLGGCLPSELAATQTTTVTLDGRTVVTSLINSVLIAPIQQFVSDSVNAYFDGLLGE